MADGTRIARRHFLALTGAALAAPALAGASPVVGMDGRAFGTGWRVALPSGRDPERYRAALVALLDGIDRQMSPWRDDSDVTAFNRAGAGAFGLPRETLHVTAAALDLAARSGGRFDPTVGPFVARYGFGPIAEGVQGWNGLTLAGDAVEKAEPGLTLDLCGVAKGRALDLLGEVLLAGGESDFLIDLGGELIAHGLHPEGRPWRAGIDDPRDGQGGLAAVLPLAGAIATSGVKAQGYTMGERRYSHIIDPVTDAPVAGDLLSVSVRAADAMTADGWATALMAAGAEGPDLARAEGIAAYFLFADGTGLRRVSTGGFTAEKV